MPMPDLFARKTIMENKTETTHNDEGKYIYILYKQGED